MAVVAESRCLRNKHFNLFSTMRIMTGRTTVFQRIVLEYGGHLLLNIIVTHEAKRVTGFWQHILICPIVWIMAISTTVCHNRMDMFAFDHLFFTVVAHQAERCPLFSQLVLDISSMRIVTGSFG